MKPMITDATEKTWGNKRFLPDRFDPREAEPWMEAVWAKYLDMKPVSFQPKKGITLEVAIDHLQALMSTTEVQGGRRLLAAGYLCSLWFESFEIELDGWDR